MNFLEAALKEIFSSLPNDYDDNWDSMRFGHNEPHRRSRIKSAIQKLLNKKGYYHATTMQHLISRYPEIKKFEFLYDHLESGNDKDLLTKVLAYRLLGHRKVKLPLNTPDYWNKLKALEALGNKSDFIDPKFLHFSLYKMNLNTIGYPIEFYFTVGGIMIDFIVKQYEYNKNGIVIKAEKGDIVIDGGGCWGDTALYFANEVGKEGRVFSFEFIPNNISIFESNISLNPALKSNIELIPNPLWKNSMIKVYFKDNGPGSKVSFDSSDDLDGECNTITIDDLVEQKKLGKVDFIKMDIEGAETSALEGAKNVIMKFRPKLAISLYHSMDDFERIPSMIKEMVPEYKFYFSHCTINAEESVLFAKIV